MGAANDEATRGVQVVHCALVEVLGGHNRSDDVLHKLLLDVLLGDVFRVLRRDDDGVHADGDGLSVLQAVLARHLRLAIGAHPRANTSLSDLGQARAELRGQVVRKGHEGRSLVGGIAKHNALVTSSNILELDVVDRLGNICVCVCVE